MARLRLAVSLPNHSPPVSLRTATTSAVFNLVTFGDDDADDDDDDGGDVDFPAVELFLVFLALSYKRIHAHVSVEEDSATAGPPPGVITDGRDRKEPRTHRRPRSIQVVA